MGFFKKISKRVLWVSNVLVVILFLLSCTVQYMDPQQWPLVSLITLAFPFLLLLTIAFLLGWLVARSRWITLSGIALILGSSAITNFYAFNRNTSFAEEKEGASIRIATWNVARFIEMVVNNNKGSQTRYKMLQQIRAAQADVLCFQEFSSSISPDWYNNIVAISKGLNYPYYYFSHDSDGDRLFNGNVIFSRYPIADTGMVRYPRPTLPEAIVFADIKKGNRIFRVYTSHLQSNQFRKEDRSKIAALQEGKGLWGNATSIFSKLSTAISHRSIQAAMVADIMKNSPYPAVFCGDLNDIPNSYTYNKVKGDMQDAFLKKGWGMGRTYNSFSPTLRIDYIFADKNFDVRQFKRVTTPYSDHYMLVADVAFR